MVSTCLPQCVTVYTFATKTDINTERHLVHKRVHAIDFIIVSIIVSWSGERVIFAFFFSPASRPGLLKLGEPASRPGLLKLGELSGNHGD